LEYAYPNTLNSLAYNAFTGTLPASWSALSQLTHLDILDVKVTGHLPSSWSAMSSLQGLFLRGSALVVGLNALDISSNPVSAINGSLPASWGSLHNLKYLYISDHLTLTGSLPAQWSTLNNVSIMIIQAPAPYFTSSLAGNLPPAWSSLRSLRELNVVNNHLTGTLPPEYSTLGKDGLALFVSGNKLTGTIPIAYDMTGVLVSGFPYGQLFPPPPAPPAPPSPAAGHRISFWTSSGVITTVACCMLVLYYSYDLSIRMVIAE
jgi:hypothetical protein